MPELSMTEAARTTFVDQLGFRPRWVDDVVSTPDDTEILEIDGLTIHLYTKKITQGRRPSVMVVGAEIKPRTAIGFVFRLFDDFERDLAECAPLELVALVARRFGADISIGGVQDRFFIRRDIPVSSTNLNEVFRVTRVLDHDYHGTSYLRVSAEDPPIANCALVFFLDVTAYRQYLRR